MRQFNGKTILVFLFFFSGNKLAWAQNTDDYRSHQTGNWNSTSTWERWNGSTWVTPAPATPTSARGATTIQNGHAVTVTAGVTVDQVVVDMGGQITLNNGVTLTIANGTGTDLSVSGTFQSAGTITINAGATIAFNSGATYQHSQNGGTVPTATWNSSCTCLVTGTVATLPGGLNQSFGNFTWNCSGQTVDSNLGRTLTIGGNMTIQSTGVSGRFRFAAGTSTIAGNYIQSGGFVRLSGTSARTVTVSGSFNMSGGTLEMSTGAGIGTLNVAGNFSHTAGTIQESGTANGAIVFNGSGTQTYTSGGTVSNTTNFTVNNGSTLQMTSGSTITGGGAFTLSSGATLGITSTAGITSSGASGNIQVTGTRTYSTGGNYTYNGTSAQNTGNGLPSTLNNLTINNSAGVTLQADEIVTNTLTLTSGNITTGTNSLTLGTSTSSLGTLTRTSGTIVGNFKRWFTTAAMSNVLFPVGTSSNYRPSNISFTVAPTVGGTLTASFVTSNPGANGLPLDDAGTGIMNCCSDGYWSIAAGGGLTGGTYSLDLTADGFGGVVDYTVLRIMKRPNASSAWVSNGTHAAGTGSNTTPVAHRTGMSGFSEFGIGGSSILASFKVLLQGPYNTGTLQMNKTLNTGGYLAAHFGAIPIPAEAVDSITVELRNAATGPTTRKYRPAWLMTDGTIRAFADTTKDYVEFDTLAGNYYLVLYHRNHLAIMTSGSQSLSAATPAVYDFTTAQSQAYGVSPMVAVGSRFAMWAGDVNGNGQLKYNLGGNDRASILSRIGGTNINATVLGYYPEDVNLNGQVKYNLGSNDRAIILSNIGGSNINATRSTQVP